MWEHFTINAADGAKASCSICGVVVSRGGTEAKSYNTTNLRKHLESKHHEEYRRLEVKEREAAKAKGGAKQMTLAESIDKVQPYAFDHPRAREIHKRIGEMIAVDNEPFTLVNHVGFARLMNLVEPRYQFPSDKYFSEKLIPEMYEKVCGRVKILVSKAAHVSITTDVWSSVAQDSYISLTAHYITPDFEHQQVCLHAAPFNDRHTGEHIVAMLTKCLENWNLAEKLHVVVRDNGSNFVAGLRDGEIPNIPCLAHTLQLVVKDGCLGQPAITDLTAKARKLVGHYKHSNIALQSLLKIQEQLGMPRNRLIQDEPTRWNTTFYMLQRLLEQKKAITAAGVELEVPIELTSANWALAEKAMKVLQVYEEATREASGDYSSASVVIPVVNSIMRSLEVSDSDTGVMKMKRGMLASLKHRYENMESNEYFAIATLLDPRFKLRVFSSTSSGALAKQMLISSYETLESQDNSNPPSPKRMREQSEDSEPPSSLLWKFCNELIEEKSETESSPKSTQSVIDSYLKEPNQPRKSSPLAYWKDRQSVWPILANLAQQYLCAPPATVASERLFSAAANICTDSRNRLSPKKVEQLLFLNKNLQFVSFDY